MRGFAYLLSALALACVSQATAQTAPPPVEAYGSLPFIGDAAISPDGTRLAEVVASGAQTGIRVFAIDGGATVRALSAPDRTKVRSIEWADNDHVLYVVSQAYRAGSTLPPGVRTGGRNILEYWRTIVLTVSTGRSAYVQFNNDDDWMRGSTAGVIAPIAGDAGTGRMISFTNDGYLAIYRVPFDGSEPRAAMTAGPETVDIVLNERGTIGARIDSDQRTNQWRLYTYDQGTPRQILEGVAEVGAAPSLAGFTIDGRLVVSSPSRPGAREHLYSINPGNGEQVTLAESDRFDVSRALADPWTHQIIGAAWLEDLPKSRYFDPSLQQVYDRLQQRFASGYARMLSWSQDRRRFLVFAETQDDAGAYYVYEPASDTLRAMAQTYPALRGAAALGNRQAITYRARDGVRIPAYLTTPGTGEARNLPAVVLVHGGPHARDNFAFDWWASFLASRGYAVLQPNYRGSTGYGYDWYNAGRRQWGDGIMQTDVEDGLAALIRGGVVDPRRVCIVGASYGGYAALVGATLTPNLYACAISIAGPSDLPRMLDETVRVGDASDSGAQWWKGSIGDRIEDRDHLRQISPANRAADVRIPILIMHGQDDTVVPIAQSRIMRDRLQSAGKDVRYVELQGDDHWLSLGATRTQMLRESEAFLAQHIGASAPAH